MSDLKLFHAQKGALGESENTPTPAWHEAILSSRRAKIEAGTADYIALEELKNDQRLWRSGKPGQEIT